MVRLLLILMLFPTALASGLATFVLMLFAFMAGLEIAWVAVAAVAFAHAYMSGLTLEHLKGGDDEPWTWIAVALIVIAAAVAAIFHFA